MNRAFILSAVMVFVSTVFTVFTNTLKSASRVNDWDWAGPSNFEESAVPVAGDSVRIQASTDILVTNAASLLLVAELD